MSLAVLKRKTMNGNPRQAPISGSNNGTFGFSLNGTRRGNHTSRETNLAPGAMTGVPQLIASTPSKPTGPGIYGHPSSVCTNDPTVVKTTVMNTRGMLAKRLRGIERIPPMAPIRARMPENGSCPLNGADNNSCGCEMGGIIEPAYTAATQYWSKCDFNKFCTGPLSVNWVKPNIIPNGNQSLYIETIVKINGKSNSKHHCHSHKSFNGIIGVLDLSGLIAVQNIPQGCNTNGKLNLTDSELEILVKSHSIMPFYTSCRRANIDIPIYLRNCADRTPVRGMEIWTAPGRHIIINNAAKPGITTVDYGTYISRRLKINNYIPPQSGCNMPQPQPNHAVTCRETPYNSYWNNNIPPSIQWPAGPFTNLSFSFSPDGKTLEHWYLSPSGIAYYHPLQADVFGLWKQVNSNTVSFVGQGAVAGITARFVFSEPLFKIPGTVTVLEWAGGGGPYTETPNALLSTSYGSRFKDLPKPYSEVNN